MSIFYKMSLEATEEGLAIFTRRYVSIRETEQMHFCVSEHDHKRLSVTKDKSAFAKELGLKIYRVHKRGSRIADATEQQAFEQLKIRKKRQIIHLMRNLAIVERFVADTEGKDLDSFPDDGSLRVLPETSRLVNTHYRFD